MLYKRAGLWPKKAWNCIYSFFYCVRLRKIKGNFLTLYGFYGASDFSPVRNIGDNAILIAMLESLSQFQIPKLILLIDSEGKFSKYGIERKLHFGGLTNLRQWYDIIEKTEIFVLGGGGLFQDYTGEGGTTFYLFMICLMFRIAGRKIMWYSCGIGPLNSYKSKILTSFAAKISDIISVRDIRSKHLLNNLKITDKKVVLSSDPVFGLDISKLIKKEKKIISGRKLIGLSILPFYEASGISEKRDNHIIFEYKKFIKFLLKKNFDIILLAFENTQDIQIFNEILQGFNGEENKKVQIYGRNCTVNELLTYCSSLDYFIGMRYHSIIFCYLCNIPSGAIIYHPKVRSLVNDADMNDYACEIESLSAERLKEVLANLQKDSSKLKSQMKQFVSNQKDLLSRNLHLLTPISTHRHH